MRIWYLYITVALTCSSLPTVDLDIALVVDLERFVFRPE